MRPTSRDKRRTRSSPIMSRGSRATPTSRGKRLGRTGVRTAIERVVVSALKAFIDLFPVDDIPPGADVVRPPVLVLQVVRVLPHVEAHDRLLAFHQRIVLIRGAGDRELAPVVDQPRPARAESSDARGAELLSKLREIPE